MENKNMNNTSYTSRTEKKQIEEELKNKQLEKEKELETKRQELKSIIFDDEKEKICRKPRKQKIENNKEEIKKPKLANTFLSLTYVSAIALSIFLILDSTNRIDQVYQIINAFLIMIIMTCFLISFKKSFFKNKSVPTTVTALLVLGTIAFNGLYMTNVINLPTQSFLPDFESENLTKAINWTEENNVKTDQNFEYSDTTKKYSVISQSKKPETLTKNINKVEFVVSNGPDYNKNIILADMTGWNVDDVLKFIENNFLSEITINFEENENIKKDTVFSQSKTGTIKRNEPIIFTVSLGDKNTLSPIKLKDLKNESLLNAEVYLGRNGILYELKYEFSDTVEKGHVINSNPKQEATVKPDEMVTLTISKGKKIKVPDLKNKTMSYVTKWMVENNLQINYKDQYDSKIKSGRVIESNYKKGDIIEEGTTVDITFSKGPLVMKKFDNINDFKSWADTNGIKYEIKEEFNEKIEKDKIIKTSIEEGKNINLEDTITVYVSKGKAVTIPNFNGMTKKEAENECDKLGIKCTFKEEYSTKSSGKVINQSIAEGTQISKGDTIVITISTNKKTNTTRPSNNSSSISSNNSSSSGGNSSSSSGSSNNGTTTSTPPKTFNNIYVQSEWVNGEANPTGNCSKIKAGIQGQTSNKVNITCSYKASAEGRGTGKLHEESPYQVNKSYSFTEGKTYTFIIVS